MVYDQLLAAGENWRARWVVVVGRRYMEDRLTTRHIFFLRQGMLLNSRSVIGYAANIIWLLQR